MTMCMNRTRSKPHMNRVWREIMHRVRSFLAKAISCMHLVPIQNVCPAKMEHIAVSVFLAVYT